MTRRARWGAVVALFIIAIGLIAGVPVDTRNLASRPRAPLDYAASVAAVGRRRAAEATTVVPSGRTILLTHERRTPIAVLLLHGYTNSPRQFDSLGAMLFRGGDNVYIPLLPHHAALVGGAGALGAITAEELRAASDSAMDIARALGDSVVVVGLSLGGTMAAWIAQNRTDATRVVIIAPVMALARVPQIFDHALVNLAVRLPNVSYGVTRYAGEPDRELGWSTRAVGQILRLGVAVERAADRQAPASRQIAMLLNANDHTISARPVLALAEQWTKAGASVSVDRLPASLGLPHDVIDPRQEIQRLDVVYPAIVNLVHGRRLSRYYRAARRPFPRATPGTAAAP